MGCSNSKLRKTDVKQPQKSIKKSKKKNTKDKLESPSSGHKNQNMGSSEEEEDNRSSSNHQKKQIIDGKGYSIKKGYGKPRSRRKGSQHSNHLSDSKRSHQESKGSSAGSNFIIRSQNRSRRKKSQRCMKHRKKAPTPSVASHYMEDDPGSHYPVSNSSSEAEMLENSKISQMHKNSKSGKFQPLKKKKGAKYRHSKRRKLVKQSLGNTYIVSKLDDVAERILKIEQSLMMINQQQESNRRKIGEFSANQTGVVQETSERSIRKVHGVDFRKGYHLRNKKSFARLGMPQGNPRSLSNSPVGESGARGSYNAGQKFDKFGVNSSVRMRRSGENGENLLLNGVAMAHSSNYGGLNTQGPYQGFGGFISKASHLEQENDCERVPQSVQAARNNHYRDDEEAGGRDGVNATLEVRTQKNSVSGGRIAFVKASHLAAAKQGRFKQERGSGTPEQPKVGKFERNSNFQKNLKKILKPAQKILTKGSVRAGKGAGSSQEFSEKTPSRQGLHVSQTLKPNKDKNRMAIQKPEMIFKSMSLRGGQSNKKKNKNLLQSITNTKLADSMDLARPAMPSSSKVGRRVGVGASNHQKYVTMTSNVSMTRKQNIANSGSGADLSIRTSNSGRKGDSGVPAPRKRLRGQRQKSQFYHRSPYNINRVNMGGSHQSQHGSNPSVLGTPIVQKGPAFTKASHISNTTKTVNKGYREGNLQGVAGSQMGTTKQKKRPSLDNKLMKTRTLNQRSNRQIQNQPKFGSNRRVGTPINNQRALEQQKGGLLKQPDAKKEDNSSRKSSFTSNEKSRSSIKPTTNHKSQGTSNPLNDRSTTPLSLFAGKDRVYRRSKAKNSGIDRTITLHRLGSPEVVPPGNRFISHKSIGNANNSSRLIDKSKQIRGSVQVARTQTHPRPQGLVQGAAHPQIVNPQGLRDPPSVSQAKYLIQQQQQQLQNGVVQNNSQGFIIQPLPTPTANGELIQGRKTSLHIVAGNSGLHQPQVPLNHKTPPQQVLATGSPYVNGKKQIPIMQVIQQTGQNLYQVRGQQQWLHASKRLTSPSMGLNPQLQLVNTAAGNQAVPVNLVIQQRRSTIGGAQDLPKSEVVGANGMIMNQGQGLSIRVSNSPSKAIHDMISPINFPKREMNAGQVQGGGFGRHNADPSTQKASLNNFNTFTQYSNIKIFKSGAQDGSSATIKNASKNNLGGSGNDNSMRVAKNSNLNGFQKNSNNGSKRSIQNNKKKNNSTYKLTELVKMSGSPQNPGRRSKNRTSIVQAQQAQGAEQGQGAPRRISKTGEMALHGQNQPQKAKHGNQQNHRNQLSANAKATTGAAYELEVALNRSRSFSVSHDSLYIDGVRVKPKQGITTKKSVEKREKRTSVGLGGHNDSNMLQTSGVMMNTSRDIDLSNSRNLATGDGGRNKSVLNHIIMEIDSRNSSPESPKKSPNKGSPFSRRSRRLYESSSSSISSITSSISSSVPPLGVKNNIQIFEEGYAGNAKSPQVFQFRKKKKTNNADNKIQPSKATTQKMFSLKRSMTVKKPSTTKKLVMKKRPSDFKGMIRRTKKKKQTSFNNTNFESNKPGDISIEEKASPIKFKSRPVLGRNQGEDEGDKEDSIVGAYEEEFDKHNSRRNNFEYSRVSIMDFDRELGFQNINQYVLKNVLGKGNYAEVKLAFNEDDKKNYVS